MNTKLQPRDLAVTLENFDLIAGEYSHVTQRNRGLDPRMTGTGTTTFGGTRTFGGGGQPSDSDQDNDRTA